LPAQHAGARAPAPVQPARADRRRPAELPLGGLYNFAAPCLHDAMNRFTLFAALLIPVLVPALAGPARADAPVIGEVSWRRADAHCAFARIGAEAPPDSYLFVTELVSDDSI